MEQSTRTGLELATKTTSRKQTTRKMGYPTQDPVSPKRESVSLVIADSVQ